MELSGTEILIQSLTDHNVDTIFGYPGACVISIVDNLLDNKTIRQILVRHEQGAVHAACGYAQYANKPGVVLVTSGPGATNTVTGIADAYCSEIPLLIITGQVSSFLLGTDAFQEADMINITSSITKWGCQIHAAAEIEDTVAKAFKIANTGRPGPVLLDITKDAQMGRSEYRRVCFAPNSSESILYSTILQSLGNNVVMVIDKVPNDFYSEEYFGGNRVLKSGVLNVPGFGLPAAIGTKLAAPDKTVCLIVGSREFQATIKELGVIKQQKLDIKIILINEDCGMRNPNFMQLVSAYEIGGTKVDAKSDISGSIHKMLNSAGSYLLELTI